MPRGTPRETGLQVVPGGRERTVGRVRVVAATEHAPPFPVDAVACEEDTDLVLSAPPALRDPGEHPGRLVLRALNTPAAEPGSVLVRGRHPARLLAVVHDLNHEPTWRAAWVARALEGVLDAARSLEARALALPLLGTRHGRLAPRVFLGLLGDVLPARRPGCLQRIWLMWPAGLDTAILSSLGDARPATGDRRRPTGDRHD